MLGFRMCGEAYLQSQSCALPFVISSSLQGCSLRDAVTPNGDISIEILGLPPGEELTVTSEHISTHYPKIFCAHEEHLSEGPTSGILEQMAA